MGFYCGMQTVGGGKYAHLDITKHRRERLVLVCSLENNRLFTQPLMMLKTESYDSLPSLCICFGCFLRRSPTSGVLPGSRLLRSCVDEVQRDECGILLFLHIWPRGPFAAYARK